MSRPDLPTLVSGLSVMVLGSVLLLDSAGSLHLDFGSLAPLVLTVVGMILLVSGLARRDGA
ncbi:MAG: hypothetical protein JWR30_3540 [Conexibacter sp.]|nr:hypothetical protein [Conexibacter sp.]MCZ4492009.1 hypothetical protein [Conexibacter sp.]MDX6715371.1 hypothetical protein [Baekduia sp.]MDX6732624.1 hypothetical protein [Baekduia sp.]